MSSPRPSTCPGSVRRSGRTAGVVLAAGASLALLAGCASATDGSGAAGGVAPAAATSSSSAPSVTGLAARVATAVAAATSVHVTSDLSGVAALPVRIGTVAGDVALTSGRPTAAAFTAGSFALRYVGGSAWVSLPGAPAATPWTAVSPTSSNPVVAMAASRLATLETKLAGLDPTALLGAASGLTEVGPDTVDGTAATQYRFTVDPAKLASALGAGDAAAGQLGAVPVQVWLDGADRPVRVTATPTVKGTATPVTVTLSAWSAPVAITAPDPSQVAG